MRTPPRGSRPRATGPSRTRSDRARRQLRTAPAGKDAEEYLREADVANVRCDRARVEVQRELEPAAETGAVDRRDRRVRQRADAAEERMAGARPFGRGFRRRELRE